MQGAERLSLAQPLVYAVLIGRPEHGEIFPLPSVGERHGEQCRNDVARHTDETAQIAHSEVAPVVVVEIGFIAHLIVAFPLLFPVAAGPSIVGEELVLVHQGFGDVEELETGQMGAQTIVRGWADLSFPPRAGR